MKIISYYQNLILENNESSLCQIQFGSWKSIFCLGELKLAQRQISMKDLGAIIESIDANGDGKLTYEEVKAVLKQVGGKVK